MKTPLFTILICLAPLLHAEESLARLPVESNAEEQRQHIQAYAIFAQVLYFARSPDGTALVEAHSQPGLADGPLAVSGFPQITKGTKWTGTLYPCGNYDYKLLNGTPKTVKKYATSLKVAMLSLPPPASKTARQHNKVEDSILAHVRKHYPGDYSLQEYAYNLELKALAELRPILNHGVEGVPDDILHAIELKAFGRWEDGDYEMVLYDIKKETQSYLRLNR